ncbi:hypothetical protein [Prochlorothrix hollandica]|uniref:hypothetical protein n=1 Tax=Prochlorothrix hollandica TaxID=1223 RepID=UPI0011D1FAA1|nr:hypothetical protein [Prochlorothrix hollandica]
MASLASLSPLNGMVLVMARCWFRRDSRGGGGFAIDGGRSNPSIGLLYLSRLITAIGNPLGN